MATKKLYLGIDIGAYKVGLCIYDRTKLVDFRYNPHPQNMLADLTLWKDWIQSEVKDFIGDRVIESSGICCAGIIRKGTVLVSPNLSLLNGVTLKDLFTSEIDVAHVDNDAKAFLMCEKTLGHAQNYNTVVGITLGTGVGGALLIDGNIYRGVNNAAGEFGHMTIEKNSTFEQAASARFFSSHGDPSQLQERAAKNDPDALEIFNEYGRIVGLGISNIVNIVDPEMIVLGGGLSNAFEFFMGSMRKTMEQNTLLHQRHKIPVKQSMYGREASSLGAAIFASKANLQQS